MVARFERSILMVIPAQTLLAHAAIRRRFAEPAGKISDDETRRLNALADVQQRDIGTLARDWIREPMP